MTDDELALLIDAPGAIEEARMEALLARIAADPRLALRVRAHAELVGRLTILANPAREDFPGLVRARIGIERSPTAFIHRVRERARARATRSRRTRWPWLAVVAAVILAIAVPAAALADRAHEDPPTLRGRALAPGETLAVEDDAELVFADGSRVGLHPGAVVVVAPAAGTRLAVRQGVIDCVVTRQLADGFLVTTPHGGVRVLGTRYSLACTSERTVVTVREGRVRVSEPQRPELTLGAGDRAVLGRAEDAPPAAATGVRRILASADAMVHGGARSSNLGAEPQLGVKQDENPAKSMHRRSFLRFPLDGVPAGFSRVRLVLHPSSSHGPAFVCAVHAVDGAWSESDVTWRNQPPIGAELARWSSQDAAPALDLTAHVRALLAAGRHQLDLCLDAPEVNDKLCVVFIHSREAGDGLAPALEVE